MAETYLAGVGYDEFRAIPSRFLDIDTDYGMIISGIGAYGENATGLADLGDCIGHRPASETLDQTGHSGGMSEAGAMVHIVRSHYRTSEFLYDVVFLVGTFGR